MSTYILLEFLKFIDLFGTKYNFYIERHRKLYTPIGGLLTLISIIIGIFVFIYVEKDDIMHKTPTSTTSISKDEYKKITFLQEKIWIPWRIRDYNSKTINITNLLYPIVFYYKCIYNETKGALDVSYSVINYRLCNETSMAKYKDLYILDIDLDKVYCFDMDDLLMGGNGDLDYIYYVQFDLYVCKNGIDYDENNSNCSSYEKIIEAAGKDNSFSIDLFYPVVNYQPLVKENPLFIRYNNYYYHLSRYSNKIDRIYLQKFQLSDDRGIITKNEKITTHWGYSTFSGDTYSTGDKRDLMNEGSSSRLYSFNIFVSPDVVYYNRTYKKLFLIIANGLPNVSAVFAILKMFAKILGVAYGKKRMIQLLFENIQEIPREITDKQSGVVNLLGDKNSCSNKNCIISLKVNKINVTSSQADKRNRSSLYLYLPNDKNGEIANRKNSNNNILNQLNNNNMNFNNDNNNKESKDNENNELSCSNSYKLNIRKLFNFEDKNNNNTKPKNKVHYIKKKLFPFRYYLCSFFMKNIGVTKKSIFFSENFVVVYNFVCKLMDISSYLMLRKEFQILKNTMIMKKYKTVIENRKKININNKSFGEEFLESYNISILGKLEKTKDKI